jgi:TRAP-type uncharacterized transport system substrate-binding protein
MFKELNERCAATGLTLVEMNSTGSVENLNRIIGNEVNAGFTQTDVIWLRAQGEDLSTIKTLIALHPEEVHILAMAGKKVGQKMGFGGQDLVSLEQLGGLNVGAAGGSFITAQVVRLQSQIAFNVVQFDNNKDLLAALTAGKIDAAIMVGGSPMGDIAALTPAYTLLTIGEATAGKMKGVYKAARVTYPKLNGGRAVATVSTDALLVTREYKTPKYLTGLAAFRACFVANVDELKETTGTHPKWQAVDPENKGKWAYYVLPEVKAEAPAPAKKK